MFCILDFRIDHGKWSSLMLFSEYMASVLKSEADRSSAPIKQRQIQQRGAAEVHPLLEIMVQQRGPRRLAELPGFPRGS
jgi:hypothetical protein